MGEERFERYLHSFEEETPVSIRLNPMKLSEGKYQMEDAVPWCRNAYYLAKRPNFTFDPLFHAGCYYVQDSSAMFVGHLFRKLALGVSGYFRGSAPKQLPVGAVLRFWPVFGAARCD